MSRPPVIVGSGLCHGYGSGELRTQVLHDVCVEISAGEIVFMTGPSGSGKTTLLSLMGALRSVQQGSLQVLGTELSGASPATQMAARRQIGFIFQAHNLLPALTAQQNVMMALAHQPGWRASEAKNRAAEVLQAVGLEDRMHHLPGALSGGQRQRVAIARALAARPHLVLADEPTAALDKVTGREVVELLRTLAKQEGIPILIVTHDHRILDIADRILSLEEGRLASFSQEFLTNSRNTIAALMRYSRKGELAAQVTTLPAHDFTSFLQRLSEQLTDLLDAMSLLSEASLKSFLGNLLEALGTKVSQMISADRGTVYLVDAARQELWSLASIGGEGLPVEIRIPIGKGIAGRVAATGETMNVPDAYAEPAFNREVDMQTGYRTRNILCMPLSDRAGRVLSVVQLINKAGNIPFDTADQRRFHALAEHLTPLMEIWISLHQRD